MRQEKLIFVYNADSSMFAQASDFARKILAPETYSCDLCKLTYGNVAMKREWRNFLETLPFEKVFLHKDEIRGEYEVLRHHDAPLIAVLSSDGGCEVIVSAKEMKGFADLETLIERIKNHITT